MNYDQRANRQARQKFQNVLTRKSQDIWAVKISCLKTTDMMKSWLSSICWWHYPDNSKNFVQCAELNSMMNAYRSNENQHDNKELKVFFGQLNWPYKEISNDQISPQAIITNNGATELRRRSHPEGHVYENYHNMMKRKKKGLNKYG
jgi:hypothetical protein